MSPVINCILCGNEGKNYQHFTGTERYHIECDICGRYISSSFGDLGFKNMPDEEKAMLTAYTRELFEYNSPEPQLDVLAEQNQIDVIIQSYKKKSINDKLENFIRFLAKQTSYFGKELKIDFRKDYPITYSKTTDEIENIFFLCRDLNLIKIQGIHGLEQPAKLTLRGWQKSEEIKESGTFSKKCFVAMSCNEELREIYEEGIKKAIEEAGYQPIFIEKEEHNEKICDLIISEIRSSKFLVVDVTKQRQNVYYEAGFAHGLNRNVIWTCRNDEIGNVHFDTRQYNHILWESAEDLKKKLCNRIKATII
jgi:nucleoside 2-deoxyribosyltransferase